MGSPPPLQTLSLSLVRHETLKKVKKRLLRATLKISATVFLSQTLSTLGFSSGKIAYIYGYIRS